MYSTLRFNGHWSCSPHLANLIDKTQTEPVENFGLAHPFWIRLTFFVLPSDSLWCFVNYFCPPLGELEKGGMLLAFFYIVCVNQSKQTTQINSLKIGSVVVKVFLWPSLSRCHHCIISRSANSYHGGFIKWYPPLSNWLTALNFTIHMKIEVTKNINQTSMKYHSVIWCWTISFSYPDCLSKCNLDMLITCI